jgi:O-antigen ligase
VVILRQPERQKRFVVSIVVLGCLFAVGQVLQGVFHIPVFGEKGRLVVLETMGRQDYGTTRSLTLGIEVIVFSLLLTVGAYILDAIGKPLFFTVAGLSLVGIFLSFGRTTFAVVAVCVVMVVSWLNLRKLPQLVGLFLLVVAIGSALAISWRPESFAAVYYRMTSIDTEIESGDSAQWRIWEAEEMLPHIQKYPLTGIGLGADYKGASRSSVDPDLNRYVHNAYLYMAGKMGLPALAFFLLAIAAIFAIGRRSAKSGASRWTRIVGAACAAMMISFLLASVTEPHFMEDYSLVLIAVAGALVYLSAQHTASACAPIAAGSSDLRARAKLRAIAKWRR